jgi:hypothetical protein
MFVGDPPTFHRARENLREPRKDGRPMGYRLEWFSTADELPQPLWEACFRAPQERRWWYEAIQKGGMEAQFAFHYGRITDASGADVGIVPTFVMNVPMELVAPPAAMRVIRALGPLGRPFLHQRTLFVGNVAGEGGAIGLLPGVKMGDVARDVSAALWRLRRKVGARLVVWKDFLPEQTDELRPALSAMGYFEMVSYPATLLSLPAQGGEEAYVKGLSSDYRYKLRKKMKASRASVPLRADALRGPTPAELDEIWALFWQTYKRGTTKFEEFNRKVFENFALHPGSHFLTLRREDTNAMVAFMLLTEEGDHWVNRFIGMDYDAPKELFLYYRLFVAAVEYCARHWRPHLLSGQTGYRAKLELGHDLIPLVNFTRHRNPLLHWVYAKVASGITWSTLDEELGVYLKAHPEVGKG